MVKHMKPSEKISVWDLDIAIQKHPLCLQGGDKIFVHSYPSLTSLVRLHSVYRCCNGEVMKPAENNMETLYLSILHIQNTRFPLNDESVWKFPNMIDWSKKKIKNKKLEITRRERKKGIKKKLCLRKSISIGKTEEIFLSRDSIRNNIKLHRICVHPTHRYITVIIIIKQMHYSWLTKFWFNKTYPWQTYII